MSTQDVPDRPVVGRVIQPPAPGRESAGPPLTELVQEIASVARGMHELFAHARREARYRVQYLRSQVQCDSNGDAAVVLFEVPQGASASLTWLSIDEGGATITPAAPDTTATLWHAIYAGGGGAPTQALRAVKGNLLDCRPNDPTVDAQIPFAYVWGDEKAAPRLVGPEAFIFVVDGATANAQILLRGAVCIEQPSQ